MNASAAHGMSDMKLHREPCWYASRTALCTDAGRLSSVDKDVIVPEDMLCWRAAASDDESVPEETRLLM